MAYKEITDANTSGGIFALFQYVAEVYPPFFHLFLFSLFIVFTLGSYIIQRQRVGRANFLASLAVASFLVTIISFVMSLIPGLVNPLIIVIWLVVCSIFILIFLTNNKGR